MVIPEHVAHRGYTRHYPENTLIGIEAAIQAGARYVEVDVQLAADKTPILFHDRNLKRVCGVQGEEQFLAWLMLSAKGFECLDLRARTGFPLSLRARIGLFPLPFQVPSS